MERGVRIISSRRKRLIGLLSAHIAFVPPSLAWQEGPTAREADAARLPPSLDLSLPDPGIDRQGERGVRIPGIGTIGILPKFDLGLELLYGANEREPGPDEKSQPSDVQLRATLKHRF
jgi:hypothetical protein